MQEKKRPHTHTTTCTHTHTHTLEVEELEVKSLKRQANHQHPLMQQPDKQDVHTHTHTLEVEEGEELQKAQHSTHNIHPATLNTAQHTNISLFFAKVIEDIELKVGELDEPHLCTQPQMHTHADLPVHIYRGY